MDSNPEAVRVMAERLVDYGVETIGFDWQRPEPAQKSLFASGSATTQELAK